MALTKPRIGFKVILCDAAQADPSGKLHMLGAGWTIMIGAPTAPHAVALMVQVPWDRANEPIPVLLELLDADGQPVQMPLSAADAQPVRQETELEVGRPPRVARGSTLSAVFALNVGPLPLSPGRYEWRATVAGDTEAESFQVLADRP